MADPPVDRQSIRHELDRATEVFHRLLVDASPAALRRKSNGTRWSNRQLLFHMLFGYLIVRALLPVVQAFARLPDRFSRAYARMLNAGTRPFHVINYAGSCVGALLFGGPRLARKCDRTMASLHRRLDSASEEGLRMGMHVPVGWDPYFHDFMTIEDLYRYGTRHFEHHRQQLTLAID